MVLVALGGGIGQYATGADAKGIAAGIVFGGLSGLTGKLAAATTGFTRVGWSVRSVGTAVISGTNGNSDLEQKESN